MRREENEKLTRVGPGTPAGETLRRYWWPIATSDKVDRKPYKAKILSEDIVLFRMPDNSIGVLDARCCHRGASLEFGRVEAQGLRCCYHGWLYDKEGHCLDQPCEPNGGEFRERVRQKAYVANEISGLIFVYLGPLPAPAFPKYDVLVDENCNKHVFGRDRHANFLQQVENQLDALHVMCLHTSLYPEIAFVRPDVCNYEETWFGVKMDLEYPNGTKDRHYHVFPAANRVEVMRSGQEPYQFMQFVTPVDDTECISFQIWASQVRTGPFSTTIGAYQHTVLGQYKRVEDGWWDLWERDQDDAAIESQGPISDRTTEHLATSDRGVVLYRRMLQAAIDAVEAGQDPKGVIRDPNHDVVDLYSFKTELGAAPGEIRNPDLGRTLEVIAPYAPQPEHQPAE